MKRSYFLKIFAVASIALLLCTTVAAHVPYFEHKDFTEQKPFRVRKGVEQSIAVYSWLSSNENISEDIDVYSFKIRSKEKSLYLEIIVPQIEEVYQDFLPCYALVGPGLPPPNQSLPFNIPADYGAIIMFNLEPGEDRETFYEPFGGKTYYKGPIYQTNLTTKGTYFVYCWDPYNQGGDYTLVIGRKERFGPLDILRALIYTPLIRMDKELHI